MLIFCRLFVFLREKMLQSGAIPKLVAILKGGNPNLQQKASVILENLADDEPYASAVVAADVQSGLSATFLRRGKDGMCLLLFPFTLKTTTFCSLSKFVHMKIYFLFFFNLQSAATFRRTSSIIDKLIIVLTSVLFWSSSTYNDITLGGAMLLVEKLILVFI